MKCWLKINKKLYSYEEKPTRENGYVKTLCIYRWRFYSRSGIKSDEKRRFAETRIYLREEVFAFGL
jgi:hypothetical protein